MDFKSLLKDIENKQFKPLYVLHGEEPFYIDQLSDAIIEHALEEYERDFNQMIVYGRDADVMSIINEAKGYPAMAERRLVVVREAQDLKDFYDLEKYLAQVNPTTVLVLCYKYKNIDGKRKFAKDAAKHGIVFKSDKVRDYLLNDWISTYVRSVGYQITPKAAALLGQFLGNDLSRIANELDKLAIVLEAGTNISDIHIEENIGISKDYNLFELTNALANKDTLRVFQIADYFEKNPKDHSIIQVIPQLFKLYTQLMRIHFNQHVSPDQLAQIVGVPPFVLKDLARSAKLYPPKILASNVAILHEYDLKAKGVGNSSFSDGELLREMLFQLLN